MSSPAGDQSLPDPLPADPMPTALAWYRQAREQAVQPNPDAATLATIEPDGRPSARIVLCKSIDPVQGRFLFFTNYRSGKGRSLGAHPLAAMLFHWDALARQIRVEGPVTASPAPESDEYFRSRPWSRKVAAWASEQSEPIESPGALRERFEAAMRRFGLDPARPPAPDTTIEVPRPPHWGGYRVWAQRIELWVGSEVRMHDRAVWERVLVGAPVDGAEGFRAEGDWRSTRLQP